MDLFQPTVRQSCGSVSSSSSGCILAGHGLSSVMAAAVATAGATGSSSQRRRPWFPSPVPAAFVAPWAIEGGGGFGIGKTPAPTRRRRRIVGTVPPEGTYVGGMGSPLLLWPCGDGGRRGRPRMIMQTTRTRPVAAAAGRGLGASGWTTPSSQCWWERGGSRGGPSWMRPVAPVRSSNWGGDEDGSRKTDDDNDNHNDDAKNDDATASDGRQRLARAAFQGNDALKWSGTDVGNDGDIVFEDGIDDDDDDSDEEAFLKRELTRLESLEDLLQDIEEYCLMEDMCNEDGDYEDDDDEDMGDDDDDDIADLLSLLEDTDSIGQDLDDEEDDRDIPEVASLGLEQALLQGVVPAYAQVGGDTLPGDWGFDPLHLAEKDYIHQAQYRLLSILPGGNPDNDPPPGPRPLALVLRDYREAEIRHGRLAMLAAIIWPLQEKLDKLVLEDDQFGPLVYGPVTLPYFPLLMTLLMMLLGYLDVYAKAIKEEEGLGDAFLPGDCFWDPLSILGGAPPSMKRNMQERELFNGRVAMLAIAAFVFEEASSHQAVVDIASNEILFVPAYQVSFIQEWLDGRFGMYYH